MPKAQETIGTRQVSPNKAKASILHALKIKRPIFLWGGPGIGKSEIIHQIGDSMDAHTIDIRLSLWEPTDIKGIPYFNSKENTMNWAQPSELPDEKITKKQISEWKQENLKRLIYELNDMELLIKNNINNSVNLITGFILTKSVS